MKKLKEVSSIFLLVILVNLISCNISAQKSNNYQVEIIYTPVRQVVPSSGTAKWKKQVGDSLVLFCESGFKNDNIRIAYKSRILAEKITSDEVTQFAKYFVIAPLSNEEIITLQINAGQMIKFTTKSDIRFVAINLVNNKVIIQVLEDFPYYD